MDTRGCRPVYQQVDSSPVFPTINGEISVKANTAVCESANTEFESRILPKWECANDGELGRTVNPLPYGLVGSNPTIPAKRDLVFLVTLSPFVFRSKWLDNKEI